MRDTRRRRERDESRERRRNRSRSRDRERNRSRSRDRARSGERGAGSSKARARDSAPVAEPPILTEKDFEGKTNEEIEMMKIMGFAGFDTTKNKKVKSNNVGDVHVSLKRKYRQYMNRKGGFNRPLDAIL